MSEPRRFYFGCKGTQAGHMTWQPGPHGMYGISYHATADQIPWTIAELDTGLCIPSNKHAEARAASDSEARKEAKQPQGKALVHHRDGWSALAFWDRSGDSRGNSCSVFVLEGELAFDQALAAAGESFPEVFERIDFEVVPA